MLNERHRFPLRLLHGKISEQTIKLLSWNEWHALDLLSIKITKILAKIKLLENSYFEERKLNFFRATNSGDPPFQDHSKIWGQNMQSIRKCVLRIFTKTSIPYKKCKFPIKKLQLSCYIEKVTC